MKSYNHLYEAFLSDENILLSIRNSSKGKRDRPAVAPYLSAIGDERGKGDPAEAIAKIRRIASDYHNARHAPIEIFDGIHRKKRKIIVPRYREQIVHHMIVNILIPIFERGMYEHSYASLPGRGAHRGKKAIEKWIRHDTRNVKYCLKMDIRRFFDSVPHDILIRKLERLIHDERFLDVLREVISVTDAGVPLGFYTSQWLANWYLQGLDHYIKEELRAAHYIRYMDDMVIFGSNKRELHKMRAAISAYLEDILGLSMKDNWQVFRFDYVDRFGQHHGRFLDYMGFRFYRDRTTIRRSIMLKATRKARRIARKEKPSIYELRQMMSYLGWIDCTDSYSMYIKWIKPSVNFQKCKRRISAYDKRTNREEKGHGMDSGTKRRISGRNRRNRVKGL